MVKYDLGVQTFYCFLTVVASEFDSGMYQIGMFHKVIEFILTIGPDDEDVSNRA